MLLAALNMCLLGKRLLSGKQHDITFQDARSSAISEKPASMASVALGRIFKHCATSRLRTSYRHGACVIHGWVTHKSRTQDRINFPRLIAIGIYRQLREGSVNQIVRAALYSLPLARRGVTHTRITHRIRGPRRYRVCVQNAHAARGCRSRVVYESSRHIAIEWRGIGSVRAAGKVINSRGRPNAWGDRKHNIIRRRVF